MTEEHKDIKVAKITALQAVIVAIITTFGGVLVGYLASGIGEKNESFRQEWLVLKNVGYSGPRIRGDADRLLGKAQFADKYRVILKVDNITYSYPSSAIWQGVGGNNPEQRFPLERKIEPRNISFEVLYKTNNGSIKRSVSTELQQIKTVPYGGTYQAFGRRVSDDTRGVFTINYEVRNDL